LVDYGPVGARIKRKVMDSWIDHWTSHGDIVEVDSPTITPESVLIASGHVGEFNDLMVECGSCTSAFRADHLVGDGHENSDSLSPEELVAILSAGIECPTCKESKWSDVRAMNLMFSTQIGAMKGGRKAYMRPETAQGCSCYILPYSGTSNRNYPSEPFRQGRVTETRLVRVRV